MLLPISWIKKYVDIDLTTRELADKLTLSGSHVESIMDLADGLENIYLGRIDEIKPHPDADKLVVCQVDLAREKLQIVTGAPNVKEGAYVIVATEGAVMADGMEIKKTKLRGVESNGMLCSFQELGVSESLIAKEYRDGIALLKGDFELGQPIAEAIGFDDELIELEITPNRPDCLSVIGMAREASAAVGSSLTYPELKEGLEVSGSEFSGKINTDAASKLVLVSLENVQIKESPTWLQVSLMKSGVRPVNNIVDITNYVMLEYGQPLHAYDMDKLERKQIVVDQLKEKKSFTSLDGEERSLEEGDLVITDGEKILGLAGIMGGLDSEITGETKNVLIESASFDKNQIRKTSDRLHLRSEASARFSKGVSPSLSLDAAKRALFLAEDLGAGKAAGTICLVENKKEEAKEIKLVYEHVNRLLGTDIAKDTMIDYLGRLEFGLEDKGEYALVTSPLFRSDIEIEEDLTEEVGRIYGFHNITPEKIRGQLSKGRISKNKANEYALKNDLFALGYKEVLTYSFVSPSLNKNAGIEGEALNDHIKIENPLGEEFSVMRTSILANHLQILSKNIKNKYKAMKVFELGNVFFNTGDMEDVNRRRLSMAAYGDGVDFYSFKADLVKLMERSGISGLKFEAREDIKTFHPGRCAEIKLEDKCLGYMGELSFETREKFAINKRAYGLELDLDLINEKSNRKRKYKPIVKYPAIVRDISIVVDDELTHEKIEEIIRREDQEIIEQIRLVDIYKGEQIEDGKKSLSYEIIYRAKDRTLVEDEVNEIEGKIISTLESENIYLRK